MIFSFALNPIENILNSYLRLDPETNPRLIKMAGKVIAVKCQYPALTVYYLITKDGLHLTEQYTGNVDVTLEASPLDFLRLGFSNLSNQTASIFNSNIKITGDTDTAQEFKTLFANIDIDWEEQLSHITGDVLAHQIGKFFRVFSQWAKQSKEILTQDLSEYLQEEARFTPPREELQDFYTEIDQLRDASDRIELRIQRLQTVLISEFEFKNNRTDS